MTGANMPRCLQRGALFDFKMNTPQLAAVGMDKKTS
jgi:hypothetical protein